MRVRESLLAQGNNATTRKKLVYLYLAPLIIDNQLRLVVASPVLKFLKAIHMLLKP